MKKAFLIVLLGIINQSAKSQNKEIKEKNSIDISYYNTHIGSNIAIEGNKNIKKHSLTLGLKYHLNHTIEPTQYGGNVYYKQFYAQRPLDCIGANVGYKYYLREINPYVIPYVLLNVQYASMKTKHIATYGNNHPTETFFNGPYHAFENTLGIGLSIKLNERFYLNQSGGLGVALFKQKTNSAWDYEMMGQWRVGVSIKL